MIEKVVRTLRTIGREEDIFGDILFPYNEDEVLAKFQVEDVNELKFADNVGSRVTVKSFHRVISEAPDRVAKMEAMIEATVKYLKKRVEEKKYKGLVEELPLSFEDGMVWSWCMKDDYKHKDSKVKVRRKKFNLSVYYGEEVELD